MRLDESRGLGHAPSITLALDWLAAESGRATLTSCLTLTISLATVPKPATSTCLRRTSGCSLVDHQTSDSSSCSIE